MGVSTVTAGPQSEASAKPGNLPDAKNCIMVLGHVVARPKARRIDDAIFQTGGDSLMSDDPKDWDDAYANMAHIPQASSLPARWASEAAAYRTKADFIEYDIAYGSEQRHRIDIVWPEGDPRGLCVFVHGGYWMKLGKSDWTHFAEGARAAGWAVALPEYRLAPHARISEITTDIAVAIECAADRVGGPLRLSGHSAGGHLVARMICADTSLPNAVADRIEHVLSISGLHDLRPLMRTKMNQTLRLDLDEARRESPALQEPCNAASLTAWVGGGERPEFIRQAQLIDVMWQGFDVQIGSHIDGSHDHFSVLDGLKHPDSAITRTFAGAG